MHGNQSSRTAAKEDETIFRGGLHFYTWKFSETAEFRQDVTAEAGDENTYLESVIGGISAKLLGDLALVASYTIKHNTEVPPLQPKKRTPTRHCRSSTHSESTRTLGGQPIFDAR